MQPPRNVPAWEHVQIMAQLADLKESHYRNTLALSAVIELLVEHGVFSPEDFHRKASQLEREDERHAAMQSSYEAPTSSQAVDLS